MFQFKSKQAKQIFIEQTAFTLADRIWETKQRWAVEAWVWNALKQAQAIGTHVSGNIEDITRSYLDSLIASVKGYANNRLERRVSQ